MLSKLLPLIMKKTIFAATVAVALLISGAAYGEQQLAYDPEDDDPAPRSGLKTKYPEPSQEVLRARENKTLPPHLRFNRLHKPKAAPHLAPSLDSLHDASLGSVQKEILPPSVGMKGLSPDGFGNMVDWVKVLENGEIAPVTMISDDAEEQGIFTAEIVIPAVGWTPDVIFPHKAHTIWLACSNCHEAQTFDVPFFEPSAGENPITMTEIAQGKWCGWCHSGVKEKVAFPLADCMRCHSGPVKKEPTPLKPYMMKKAAKTAGQ